MMKRALTMPGNRKTIATYLLKFLNLSYKTNEDHETQTAWIERLSEGLRQRMMWWTSLVGKSQDLPETPDGYGRSDAFGRIGNSTARKGEDGGIGEPIDLIAPASFPPMWGIEYTNLFHYNGNTNSVLMRNLGQSWGLGALVYQGGKGKVTSSNVANLARLEQLLYKIPYPKWNDSFGNTSAKVSVKKQKEEILQGCQVYVDKCMKCHGRHYTEDRVGERNRLIDNKVFALNQIHTDPNHAVIQGTPAKGLAFRQALFGATKTMVGEIKRLLNPSEAQLAQAENRPVRGKNQEHFRDPFVGENFEDFYSWLDGGDRSRKACGTAAHTLQYLEIAKKNAGGKCVKDAGRYGYIAKPLAGVWATAPYLHNGSVPNMEELLDPDKRRDLFYVGCRVYDTEKLGYVSSIGEFAAGGCSVEPESAFDVNYKFPSNQIPSVDGRTMGNGYNKTTDFNEHGQYVGGLTNGNYNGGHDTGAMVEKDPGKRRALITFLKVLAPPREHAWKGRSPYKIVNGVCK